MKEKIHYGVDAPLVPISYLVIGTGIFINWLFFHQYSTAWITLCYALILIGGGIVFLHTSFRGKIRIWKRLLNTIPIAADSKVVDLGCGHGAVLIAVAQRLNASGQAIGVDLWRNADQSRNSLDATQKNLKIAHVSSRTKLVTADMAELPFADYSFDVVTSSFAFHNIKPSQKRLLALTEAYRILKPGGRLIIVDTGHHKKQYLDFLNHHARFTAISSQNAGFSGWWTGPWMASYILTAIKK